MKLKHILAAASLAAISGTASAYPYESEFKARGAYAHDDHARGRRDGDDRHDGHRWRGGDYGYGVVGGQRHCWYERRHHRDYRVCR